ncbi:MAG: hypothetical protein IPO90_15695 [Flavobacteriales bacterium]|nr:hypothetical protein [Flavobacteriales bacterium]
MKSFFLRSLPALAVMLAATSSIAQTGNVAINNNGAAPAASAILDVSSNYGVGLIQKGMLIPRMTLAQRAALGAPGVLPQGLMVFMTTGVATTEGFYYIEYGQWMKVDRSANNWDLLGNNVGNPVNDFFGTRDNTDLTFRTNGAIQMTLKGTVGARYLGVNTTTPAEMVDVNGALRIFQTPAIVPPHQFTATTTTPGVIMFRPPGVALGDSLFATYVPPVGPPTQNIDALMWNGHWGQTGATSWIQAGQDANSGTWKKLENDYEERFTKPYTQQGTPTCAAGSVEIPTGVSTALPANFTSASQPSRGDDLAVSAQFWSSYSTPTHVSAK